MRRLTKTSDNDTNLRKCSGDRSPGKRGCVQFVGAASLSLSVLVIAPSWTTVSVLFCLSVCLSSDCLSFTATPRQGYYYSTPTILGLCFS